MPQHYVHRRVIEYHCFTRAHVRKWPGNSLDVPQTDVKNLPAIIEAIVQCLLPTLCASCVRVFH